MRSEICIVFATGIVLFVSTLGCQSDPIQSRSHRPVQGAVVGRVENPAWSSEMPVPIREGAVDGSKTDFVPQEDHLALALPFAPTRDLHRFLQGALGVKLQSRGEAHVTVITPPEFDILKNRVSMSEINAIAERMELQKSKIRPICLGRGQTVLNGKLEQTYFVVLDAPNLFEVRRAVRNRARERGGSSFDSENYHPHVTVGFTKVDLHIKEGVVKGVNSCLYPLAQRK